MINKLIVFLLLISQVSCADVGVLPSPTPTPSPSPSPQAFIIKQGQKSPIDGIIITPAKAKQIEDVTNQRDTLQLQNDSLTKSLNIQSDISDLDQQKVTILMNQDDLLAKRLQESQTLNNWEKAGYFVLGLLVPIAAGYAYKNFAK
jgi:hypothetical protein